MAIGVATAVAHVPPLTPPGATPLPSVAPAPAPAPEAAVEAANFPVVPAAMESPPPMPALKPAHPRRKRSQVGIASWYGPRFQGRLTAGGEPFDMHKLTAAHRSLPLGSRVRVTNLKNGRSVDVTINDRGPVPRARVIDLSKKAAQVLGMTKQGLARVRLQPLTPVYASN